MFDKNKQQKSKFEIGLVVRDKEGNPTGERKNVSTNNISDVSKFYEGHKAKKKRKRRRRRNKNNNGKKD